VLDNYFVTFCKCNIIVRLWAEYSAVVSYSFSLLNETSSMITLSAPLSESVRYRLSEVAPLHAHVYLTSRVSKVAFCNSNIPFRIRMGRRFGHDKQRDLTT